MVFEEQKELATDIETRLNLKKDIELIKNTCNIISGMFQDNLETVNDYTTYNNKIELKGNEFDNLFKVEYDINCLVINIMFDIDLYNKYVFYLRNEISLGQFEHYMIKNIIYILKNLKLSSTEYCVNFILYQSTRL